MGCHKIGLAFCAGLWQEGPRADQDPGYHGEVCSAVAKRLSPQGGIWAWWPGDCRGCADGSYAIPVARALVPQIEARTDFNLLLRSVHGG